MKAICLKVTSFILPALILVSLNLNAQITTQWRGNDRKGIYDEKDLLKNWPAGGPHLLWSTDEIGDGYGSPVITSDRIYVSGAIDSTGYLSASTTKGNSSGNRTTGKSG
jgi:outer membrane protein assembly factor BamB